MSLTQSEQSGITFDVDNVEPAQELLYTETLADCLARRFKRTIPVLPNGEQPVVNSLAGLFWDRDLHLRGQDIRDIGSSCHPFIDAVHEAFSQHRPLNIS